MSESTKFEVEINDCVSVYGLMAVLTKANHAYYQHQVKVKEIKPIPKIVNTEVATVAKLPEGTKLTVTNSVMEGYSTGGYWVRNGDKVDLDKYPQLRCICDVETVIDYSKIDDGSVIELLFKDGNVAYGKLIRSGLYFVIVQHYTGGVNTRYTQEEIKSIRVIEYLDGEE